MNNFDHFISKLAKKVKNNEIFSILIKYVNFLFLLCGIYVYIKFKQKEFAAMNFLGILQLIFHQLSGYHFYDNYLIRKDITETKKCRNCLRRVSLHWNVCPFCKRSDFQLF